MYFHVTVPSGIGATDEEYEIFLNLAPTFETVLLEFVLRRARLSRPVYLEGE
jgi:hypothetical protein